MRKLTYYLLKDGRVGLLRSINTDNTRNLQLGADGPFETVKDKDVERTITEEEFMKGIML